MRSFTNLSRLPRELIAILLVSGLLACTAEEVEPPTAATPSGAALLLFEVAQREEITQEDATLLFAPEENG